MIICTIATFFAMIAFVASHTAAIAKAAKEPIKVTKSELFKGLSQVVIGGFTVGFLIERTDSSKAGGGLMGGGFGGKSTARSYLEGAGATEFQAITEAAYADFKSQLAAAGIAVADRSALTGDAGFAKSKPFASPHEAKTMFENDANAKALYFAPREFSGLTLFSGDVLASGLGAIGMNMSIMRSQMAVGNFAKTSGIPVVNVIYMIDFADSDKYGGWFRMSSSVKVKAGLAVVADMSKLTIITPGQKTGAIVLKEPVAVGGDFGELKDTTSGGAKAMETVANVIGVFGGIGTNKSRKYTLTVQPEAYAGAVTEASRQANEQLIGRLAAIR